MKNLLLLIFITAAFSFTAQAGSVTIGAFVDSSFNNCPTPVHKDFLIWGNATGYNNNDSVTIKFYYGDGTDTTTKFPIWQNSFFGHATKLYTQPGFYTLKAVVTGPDGAADSTTIISTISDDCGNVTGRVYVDYNNDCIYNSGDLPLFHHRISLKQAGVEVLSSYTEQDGTYSLSVPSGNTYTLEVQQSMGYSISCPTGGSYTISAFPATNQDFAIVCNGAGYELSGSVISGFVVPGIPTPLLVKIKNLACTPTDGVAAVILNNSGFSYDANHYGNTAPDSTSGDTLYFGFDDLDLFNSQNITLWVVGDTTLQITDTVCFQLNVSPISADLDPSNNNSLQCLNVRASFDPNMKEVYPLGEGIDGRVRPDTDLNYTIYFQNTGTFTAYNIYILDTLDDQHLNVSSLEILESSHPMELYVIEGNILRFNFNNIMLPDSNSNEPLSHGFVTYKIKQKQNLNTGTVINNSASIYFDFNPPIYTNETVTTIDATLNVKEVEKLKAEKFFTLYPNPAGDIFTIKFEKHIKKGDLFIVDITGKIVWHDEVESQKQISVKHLPNGIYNVIIQSENKISKEKLLIIK